MAPPIFTTLTPPQSVTIASMPAGGVWYSFTLTEERRVRIDTASSASPETRSHGIFIATEEGGTNYSRASWSDGPGGTSALDVLLPPGTYYFVVAGADPFFGFISGWELSGDNNSAAGANTVVRISTRPEPPSYLLLENEIAPANWAAGSGVLDLSSGVPTTLSAAQAAVLTPLADAWNGVYYSTGTGNALLLVFPAPVSLPDLWFETDGASFRVRLYDNSGATILEESEGVTDPDRGVFPPAPEGEFRVAQAARLFAPLAPPVTGVKAILVMSTDTSSPWGAQIYGMAIDTLATNVNANAPGRTFETASEIIEGIAFAPREAPGVTFNLVSELSVGGAEVLGQPRQTRLVKDTKFTYNPGRRGSPGFPGQPYLPPRTVFQEVQVCSYVPLTPGQLQSAYQEQGVAVAFGIVGYENGNPIYGYLSAFSGGGFQFISTPTTRYVCRTELQQVSLPEQQFIPPTPPLPAIPEQFLYDFQLGWNARANSRVQMTRDGRYSFKVPSSTVSAVVGLARQPQRSGFADILWGFNVVRDVVKVYERGLEVADLGSQPDAALSVERRLGRIIYRVNGEVVRNVPNNSGPLVLSAALYSGGDSVEEGAYQELNAAEGTASLQPIQALGSQAGYAIGAAVLRRLTSFGQTANKGTGAVTLPRLQLIGSDATGYAVAAAVLNTLTSEGESLGPAPAYGLANVVLMPVQASGLGLTGTVGASQSILRSLAVIGSQGGYAQGSGPIRPLTAAGESAPQNEAFIINTMLVFQDAVSDVALLVVMSSSFDLESLVAVERIETGEVLSAIALDGTQLTSQEIQALLQSVMRASVNVGDPSAVEERSVWVLSLDVMGSTRYEGYDFNSFAEVGGRHFGMRADGLYVLQGQDDNGAPIDARINLGRPNMGDLDRKGLPYVYVGAASDGALVLKVVAEGRTHYYRASSDGTEVKTHRFTPGLGLRATNYELEIQNERGGAFDMASIEFVPVKLSRRI